MKATPAKGRKARASAALDSEAADSMRWFACASVRSMTARAGHTLLRLLLLAAAEADLWSRVDGIADGDHFFRQTHVLANVDQILEQGLFVAPSTWNDDMFLRMYDVPVWQALVALLASMLRTEPPLVAEGLAALLFVPVFLLVWRIGEQLLLPPLAITAALAGLVLSPIARFWFTAALPDTLAVCLCTASLAGWLAVTSSRTRSGQVLAGATWLVAAFVATLMKPPVCLATALAIGWHALSLHGWRGLLRPRLLVFAVTLLTAVAGARVLTALANAAARGWPDTSSELAWYFGSWHERFSLHPYSAVLGRVARELLSVPLTLTALVALATAKHWPVQAATRRLLVGHAIAAVAVSLLFLKVNVIHNYYQLPCLVPLVLLSGQGVGVCCTWARARWQRWSGRATWWPAAVTMGLLLGGAVWSSVRYLERIRRPDTTSLRAAGAFVAAASLPSDYVLYGAPTNDDSPAWLYFARRHGANVLATAATATLLGQWGGNAARRGARLLLFVPATEAAAAAARRAEPAWRELRAGAEGWLFVLEP